MPVATIQLPDGRTAEIEVPAGLSDAEIQSQLQSLFEQGAFDRAPSFTPDRDPLKGLVEEKSPLEAGLIAAGRGLTTVGRGLGLVDPETPSERAAYERLEQEYPVSTTVGEAAGQAAPFMIPAGPLAGAATTAGRVAGTTLLGATEAGIIGRGEGLNLGEQLQAAGIGGTVAGAMELAFPVIGRIGSKVFRRITGKAPEGAVIDEAGNPSAEFVAALEESGQTFDDIVEQATKELKGRKLEPREAAR